MIHLETAVAAAAAAEEEEGVELTKIKQIESRNGKKKTEI